MQYLRNEHNFLTGGLIGINTAEYKCTLILKPNYLIFNAQHPQIAIFKKLDLRFFLPYRNFKSGI